MKRKLVGLAGLSLLTLASVVFAASPAKNATAAVCCGHCSTGHSARLCPMMKKK